MILKYYRASEMQKGSERLSNSLEGNQRVNSKSGLQGQVFLIPDPVLHHGAILPAVIIQCQNTLSPAPCTQRNPKGIPTTPVMLPVHGLALNFLGLDNFFCQHMIVTSSLLGKYAP